MIFPNLDNLAVELVIEILRGVDIQTITSIALTSSRLYHIVKSERKIWMDASDVLDLPLETGETLATTPVQSILALSMRAILIRNRLRNAKSIPRHYRKMHDKQTNFAQKLLPGGEWMISTQGDTSNLWLISLNNGDENSNSALLFVAPTSGVIKCYAFEALGKGQIHLAVGFTTYMTEGDVDYIALMHLQPTLRNPAKPARAEGKPLVTDIKYHLLPASPLSISLRKPLVLVHTSSENHNNFHGILFDDETEAGVLLEAEHPEIEHLLEPGAQRGPMWYWQNPCIHPTLQKLVLRCSNDIDPLVFPSPVRNVILLADIPNIYHPDEATPEAGVPNSLRSVEVLRFTHIHIENQLSRKTKRRALPFPARYILVTEYYVSDRYLISLCLDTDSGRGGEQGLVPFYVNGVPAPRAWSLICSRKLRHDPVCLREVSDRQILGTYINYAHTMVSSLNIPFPPEWMQVTPHTHFCMVLDVDIVQGLILMVLQRIDQSLGPYRGHGTLHSTWVVKF